MSDNIPSEIQMEIMKLLPVKSLIQLRSVSKAWKSLIDSSDFVASYSGQQQRVLVWYMDENLNEKYVSIVDNDTFPQQQVSLTPPLFVNLLKCSGVIGSSHGLLCLHGYYYRGGPFAQKTEMAVLWNISIRKAVAVVVPYYVTDVEEHMCSPIIGFGVCRETNDPKILKITYINNWEDIESISCIPRQVEVFTLSTGAWRSSYSSNLSRKSLRFQYLQVVVGGFVYWLAIDRVTMDGGYTSYKVIISFDTTSEEFREVKLPDSLAHQPDDSLHMSKLRESLVVLEGGVAPDNLVFILWMMEDEVSKEFTKLFIVNPNTLHHIRVLGFRKSGEPIVEILPNVFERHSKHINNLGIYDGYRYAMDVYPYKETLLLLD